MLTLICGIPNAGKTTFSVYYSNVVHLDDVPHNGGRIRNCNVLAQSIEGDLCIDGVYGKARYRRELIQMCIDKSPKVCIWIDTPIEECIARELAYRNRSVGLIRYFHTEFEPPSLDEGWDMIVVYTSEVITMEYKNGVNAFGNMSVDTKDYTPDIPTGRAVFADSERIESDSAYAARVNKYIKDGFHLVTDSEDSGGGGGGSSDFSTAEVTVHFTFESSTGASDITPVISPVVNETEIYAVGVFDTINIDAGATSKDVVVTVPLYKGKLVTMVSNWILYPSYDFNLSEAPSATGNATIESLEDYEIYVATITGDCTITIPLVLEV